MHVSMLTGRHFFITLLMHIYRELMVAKTKGVQA